MNKSRKGFRVFYRKFKYGDIKVLYQKIEEIIDHMNR